MNIWQDDLLKDPIFQKEFPFQHRYLDLNGHRLHFVDEGTGPILLLLHGNPTFSFLYRHIISDLKNHFRVIAVDYPGFGLSIAKPRYDFLPESHSHLVEQFVTQLKIKDITLFVQDWGGPIGLGFAGRQPELITKLIIGNTWAWPVNGDFHFEAFSKIMGGPIGKFFILNLNAFVNLLLPAGSPKSKMPKSILKIYQQVMPNERRIATHIFPREITASKKYLEQVFQNLKNLKDKPTLILWGNKDFAFRKIELHKFEALFSKHKTIILEGAGHYIQEDSPQEICSAIKTWT